MTHPSEQQDTAKAMLHRNSQFALVVAARALVRASGINPFEDGAVAVTPVKIGAWPKEFGAVLVVCPLAEARATADAVSAMLTGDGADFWETMTPQQRADAQAEWERITGKRFDR